MPKPMKDDSSIMIKPCTSGTDAGWLALRESLWPDCPRAEHLADMAAALAEPGRFAQFIACSASGEAIGLAEASVRSDYVNGTSSSPVAFLEGIYVVPWARRRGIAASLVASVCRWAEGAGCKEIASDAALENHVSHMLHRALGFEETERVVYFRKMLSDPAS